jgi:hypothetical protein
MTPPAAGPSALLIDELVRLEGFDDAGLRAGAQAFVRARVLATSGATRLGLRLAEAAAGAWIRVGSRGRPYAALGDADRRAWAERLNATRAPAIADWSRMIRSLVLTFLYEERFGPEVGAGGASAPARRDMVHA